MHFVLWSIIHVYHYVTFANVVFLDPVSRHRITSPSENAMAFVLHVWSIIHVHHYGDVMEVTFANVLFPDPVSPHRV